VRACVDVFVCCFAMALAVSRQPVTARIGVRSQLIRCGIFGVQNDSEEAFYLVPLPV
jgi:hypothetical protein